MPTTPRTRTRYVIISRIRDKNLREDLEMGDRWKFYQDYFVEHQAFADLEYVTKNSYTKMREYLLFKIPEKTPVDLLDDKLPEGLL